LEIAAYRGDHALAMLLLDRGAPGIDRALAAAAEKGYDETVSALLARGAKADSFSPIGESALVLACKNGHLEIVKMLLNHGADPYPGVAALHQAASGGHVDLVRELLQRG
ncbi:ankyrin, partial [Gonapodya prolifera JEL478]